MKLSPDFIVHNRGGENLLIPTASSSFSGIVRGNKTMGAIIELLKEETTEEEIVASMLSRFDAPPEKVAADVAKVLAELRKIGALDE
ncbi:MAG: PqqD family protein [Clostridiales bacterium]|nr:PqqD family protein [Clostridiales bacterium]